jgi:hypothetical protein
MRPEALVSQEAMRKRCGSKSSSSCRGRAPSLSLKHRCAPPDEIDNLFSSMCRITGRGKVIVFISRELAEAL